MSQPYVFTISRTFNAPLSMVWKAWTDKSMAGRWFGPKGCTITYKRFNVTPGGEARYRIDWNGVSMHGKWQYLEVVPEQKLVSIVSFTDASGDNAIAHPGNPNWPKEVHSTIYFIPHSDKTEVRIEWKTHNASAIEAQTFAEGEESMKGGWGGSLDLLEELLATLNANTAITPYLTFSGRCEEAIRFYEKVLGAKREMVMRFHECPDPLPPGMLQAGFEDKVMHASFLVRGSRIMASDGCDDKTRISGVSLSLSLHMEEIDEIFAKLADDGSVSMPLCKTFFAPRFGMLTDKFGVAWMLIVPEDMAEGVSA